MCFSRWKLDMERSYQIHEKQTTKNIGLLFWSKQYPSIKCLLSLYYSYIHAYISYACGSSYISNLKKSIFSRNMQLELYTTKK